jgi:NAD-dependent deacetylase
MRADQDFEWADIEPNAAHRAIADLEKSEKFQWLITQNVDGLHQEAGSTPERVLELHGTRREAKCMECDRRVSLSILEAKLEEEPLPPRCEECEGLLKRATVSFGESLPTAVLSQAREAAQTSDCFLVVGSSLSVEPAASLPRVAAENGAELLIVNLTETPLDRLASVVMDGQAGTIVPKLVAGVLGDGE